MGVRHQALSLTGGTAGRLTGAATSRPRAFGFVGLTPAGRPVVPQPGHREVRGNGASRASPLSPSA